MSAWLMLLGAGFVAGVLNAVAGGGSFVSLPALVLAGLPSTLANASSTVALLPGGLATTWAYRKDLQAPEGLSIPVLLGVSVLGGLVGALLLLLTPTPAFDLIVPWLLLIATLAFTFGGRIGEWLRRRVHIGRSKLLGIQSLLAVYGGYFGGGVGIMMLAAWSLLTSADLRALNPVRALMVIASNAAAVGCFIVAGAVRWPETLAVMAGALAGGYLGALVARRLPVKILRAVVITVAVAMTVAFFVRAA